MFEPFKAFATGRFSHEACNEPNPSIRLNNYWIKSEPGSIARQSIDEFFAKQIMTPALIEDMN